MDRKARVQDNTKHIGLFFTYGVSLALWEKKGVLERELALYQQLAKKGYRFSFFTYGADDHRFAEQLREHNITILEKRHAMSLFVYSLLLPFFYIKELRQCDILKTNQMHGSWTAVFAKWITRKPLIVRTGYMLSTFARRRSWVRYSLANIIERFACRFANRVVVATETDKVCFRCCEARVEIIPNYVDTERFSTIVHQPKKDRTRILFVGRLEPQKNVGALIEAVQHMKNVTVTIIGDGSQRVALEKKAEGSTADIHFLGHLPQERVRKHFAQTDIFVLPSLYEGLPKILLEAMAAGLPIVTTDVPGIRTVVSQKKTAIVVEPHAQALREGIDMLLQDASLSERIGRAAQQEAQQHYSLDTVITQEIALYDAIH